MPGSVGFLNENESRTYPFEVGSTSGDYLKGIVDVTISLGPDAGNYVIGSVFMVLDSIINNAPFWTLRFKKNTGGAFFIDVNVSQSADRFTTWHGQSSSGKSYAYVTIGRVSNLSAVSPNARLEMRTVIAPSESPLLNVTVYNIKRRQSFVPFYNVVPTNTPADDYGAAQAAAGAYNPDVVDTPGDVVPGPNVGFDAGYNLRVRANASTDVLSFSMVVGSGLGRSCEELEEDEALLTRQGTIRSINGYKPVRGELRLAGGTNVRTQPDPENHRVIFTIAKPVDRTACPTTDSAVQQPPTIPEPPGWDPNGELSSDA